MINFITTKHFNDAFYLKDGQLGLKEVVKICSRGIQFVIESIQQRDIDIAQTSKPFTMRQVCNENLPSYIILNKYRTNVSNKAHTFLTNTTQHNETYNIWLNVM